MNVVSGFGKGYQTKKFLKAALCFIDRTWANITRVILLGVMDVPYILAYKYVASISRKYFLRQILGNLLMSRL